MKIDRSMEGGSVGMVEVVEPDLIRVLPRRDYNHEGRNWTAIWFHFAICGGAGRRVRIEFMDLTCEWNYGSSFAWGEHTRPVFSSDGRTWRRVDSWRFHQERRTLVVEQTLESDRVEMAYVEPYPVSRAQRLIAELSGKPGVMVDTIGRSVEGSDLSRVTIGDPNRALPRAWVLARQHPWETGTSFAAEGLLRFLTSDADEARAIRERVTFVVLPMLNPDGVTRGGTRYNARGYDPNRNLEDATVENVPETYHLLRAMGEARDEGRGPDLVLNLHNNNQEARDLVGGYFLDAGDRRLWQLGHSLSRYTFFRGEILRWPHADSSLPPEYGLGMLVEMQTGYITALKRYVTAEDQCGYGRGLAFAIDAYFELRAASP